MHAAPPHLNINDQRESIVWARRILKRRNDYVIVDTETTGLGEADEIIQLAAIDPSGNILFDSNICPSRQTQISHGATAIHGLTMEMLRDCPRFSDLAIPLRKALGVKLIVTYNALFDARLYLQSYLIAGGYLTKQDWECAMHWYAKYVGEWNYYHNDYKWQKLAGGDHTALGDCFATLRLIEKMATTQTSKRWYQFWLP